MDSSSMWQKEQKTIDDYYTMSGRVGKVVD
jgi:hypothetical protein